MKKFIIALAVIGTFVACGNNDTAAVDEKAKQDAQEKLANPEPMSDDAQIDITGLTVEARDPYCNMKVATKVADTATINGKLYGFCAKSCKEKYLEEVAAKQ